MRNIFLDTNVILDFFMEREGFKEDAEQILAMGYERQFRLFASSLSFSNVAYIARSLYKGETIYDLLGALREMVSVTKVDAKVIDLALALRAKDFEDALQYYSALSAQCDVIITRNTKDFYFSELTVSTPAQFLSGL